MPKNAIPERSNPVTTVVPIDLVHTWKENPRQVKKGDYDRLKKQILELGFYKALVATPDLEAPGHYIVLGGNTRLRALKDLGWTEVGLTIVDAPTEDLKLKYNISDNDSVGAWDDQALAEIAFRTKDKIESMDIFKIQIGAPQTMGRLMDQFGPSAEPDEDQVPPADRIPVTQPGDLFTLGPHRLLCGDATKPEDYTRLLEGKPADLIFTDPPYNINYRPLSKKYDTIMNDNMGEEAFLEFCEAWMAQFTAHLKDEGSYYICSDYSSFPPFLYAIKKNGLVFSGPIVWVKTNSAGWSRNDYRHRHEMALQGKKGKKAAPILYGWKGGRHYFFEHRFEADVWEYPRRATVTMLHPTQKPLALIQRAIKNSSRPGELVLDPFAGSGSTLIAADREGRAARLLELDPIYCDVIIRRWAAQGQQTENEIRAGRQSAADMGPAGLVRAERPRGKGKGKASSDRPAQGQKQG